MIKCNSCKEKKLEFLFYYRNKKQNIRRKTCKNCINLKNKKIRLEKRNPNLRKYSKYTLNEEAFNQETEEVYYYAGLLAADGCLFKTSEKSKRLSLTLHEKDITTIENFKNFIKFDGNILFYRKKYPYISITGANKLVNTLEKKFNIVTNKSLIYNPPKIDNLNLALAFIVGYIDGDGCLYKSKNGKFYQIQILGTQKMLDFVCNIFKKIEPSFNLKPRKSSSKTDSVKAIAISGNFKSDNYKYKNILKHLLGTNVPKMKRKWNLLLN
jgi:hypothetical protein